MVEILTNSKADLNRLFLNHKVKKAYAFGSSLSDSFNPESDIDLLIEFEEDLDALERGELWWSLYDALREHFSRNIDLLTTSSLKNPYFIKEVEQTKQLIYG